MREARGRLEAIADKARQEPRAGGQANLEAIMAWAEQQNLPLDHGDVRMATVLATLADADGRVCLGAEAGRSLGHRGPVTLRVAPEFIGNTETEGENT